MSESMYKEDNDNISYIEHVDKKNTRSMMKESSRNKGEAEQ